MIILHYTAGMDAMSSAKFLVRPDVKASAHVVIGRDGQVIQMVPFNIEAWHAGKSSYGGRNELNHYSIGIELEGCDTLPFEAEQYVVLAALLDSLGERFPVADAVGHSEVAPGRQTDPGPYFDWSRLRRHLLDRGGRVDLLDWRQGLPEPVEAPIDPMRWPFPLSGRPG